MHPDLDHSSYLKYPLDRITALMESDVKAKEVDWSQFRPWNIDPKVLQQAWDGGSGTVAACPP